MRFTGQYINLEYAPALFINRTTYDKAERYPDILTRLAGGYNRQLCRGYELRTPAMPKPDHFTVHTTESPAGQRWPDLLGYLYRSPDVSVYYAISPAGAIVRFLRPDRFVAWANGAVYNSADDNYHTISIELFRNVGPQPITPDQKNALAALILECSYAYNIDLYSPVQIRPHRHIAVPQGEYPGETYAWPGPVAGWRRTDPCTWADADFAAWRRELIMLAWPQYKQFIARLG